MAAFVAGLISGHFAHGHLGLSLCHVRGLQAQPLLLVQLRLPDRRLFVPKIPDVEDGVAGNAEARHVPGVLDQHASYLSG
jgi:hypothetical protein